MLIMGLISETFISIGIWILSGIYTIVSSAFRLFLVLAEGKIVAASAFSNIFNNVYVIIGVVMLFILAFALLKGMVNPDDKKQGASTVRKVITNLITSSIIVVLLPTIFSFAYDFQDSVLYYNVIGKLFGYGVTDVESNTSRISIGANRIANGVFTAFFSPKCENGMDLLECQDAVPEGESGRTYGEIVEEVDLTGNFMYYTEFSDAADNGDINFNFIMGLIAGLALLYVAISFCFDMAVRLIKLVFYQLIAPIPIYFRVIPEGKLSGSFNNWIKITLTCYLEVFIRILVFYFCVFIFNSIFDSDVSILDIMIKDSFLNLLAKAFIIMGIVMFMKQAPKLFSEITGLDSGNMKLGIREKLKEGGAFTAGAIIGAGATAFTRNAVNAARNIRNKYEKDEKGRLIRDANGKLKRKNDEKTGKAYSTGSIIRSYIAGAGSVIAGTASAQYRGFMAGKDAKSEKDMIMAAGKGAKGATDARDERTAYRVANKDKSIFVAKANDYLKTAKEWASGGFEAQEGELKAYNDLLAIQDSAKAAAEKVINKFPTNVSIVAKNLLKKGEKTFKGVVDSEQEEFKALFADSSLATIENTINSLRNQKLEKTIETDLEFNERVRAHRRRINELKAENMEMLQGENYEDYVERVKKHTDLIKSLENQELVKNVETDEHFTSRVREHNAHLDAFNSMYQQLRKETVKNIESLAFIDVNTLESKYGIKEKDILATRAELTKAQDMFNAMGLGQEMDLKQSYSSESGTGAGFSFDDAASKIEQKRNKLSADVARQKAERDRRQGNSK